MTLILNNAEITSLLPMPDCLARLDETYRDMGLGQAGNRPRSDIYGPVHDNGRYVFKTMDGLLPCFEVAAIRLNSDVIRWQHGPHGLRNRAGLRPRIRALGDQARRVIGRRRLAPHPLAIEKKMS